MPYLNWKHSTDSLVSKFGLKRKSTSNDIKLPPLKKGSHQMLNRFQELSVKIGDKFYMIASDDDYLTHIGSEFEPEMCTLFKSLIKKNHKVFDVGANIGCTSILFGDLASYVDSFEPSPSTFKILEKNLATSLHSNTRIHNFGLGAKNENLTLTFSPSNRSGGFVSDKTQASKGHSIENIVIKKGDDFSPPPEVDFIKIDVEGYEKNVIEGLLQTILKNRPVIVLELNHWCLNAFQRISIPDFFDFLANVFPILYAVDGDKYLNLHDESDRYIVMYHHIIHFKFPNIVAAFDQKQLNRFHELYNHRD
jgi:FkbM family methyltransferase